MNDARRPNSAVANRAGEIEAASALLLKSRGQLIAASVLFGLWLLFLIWMALDP